MHILFWRAFRKHKKMEETTAVQIVITWHTNLLHFIPKENILLKSSKDSMIRLSIIKAILVKDEQLSFVIMLCNNDCIKHLKQSIGFIPSFVQFWIWFCLNVTQQQQVFRMFECNILTKEKYDPLKFSSIWKLNIKRYLWIY